MWRKFFVDAPTSTSLANNNITFNAIKRKKDSLDLCFSVIYENTMKNNALLTLSNTALDLDSNNDLEHIAKTNLQEFAQGSRTLNSQELAKIMALSISTTMMVAETCEFS